MGLRADQVELTRRRIIDAVLELSADAGEGGRITVSEVARRSGISPATIYRHFPTRDALIHAAAHDRALAGTSPGAESIDLDDQRQRLLVRWQEFAQQVALVRQTATSEAGLELRRARFAAAAPILDDALAAAGVDPTDVEVRRALSCVHLLSSSLAFLDLHDRQDLSVSDAVASVDWGTRELLRAVGVDPDELRYPVAALAGSTAGKRST